MSIAIQINNVDASPNGDVYVEGVLVPSGSYVASGDTVDFSGVNSTITGGTNFSGATLAIPSTLLKTFNAWSQGGNLARQYVTNSLSGLSAKLKISASATFGTELSVGAYPADITSDSIAFQASFKKLF